jgi:hypothetical protein
MLESDGGAKTEQLRSVNSDRAERSGQSLDNSLPNTGQHQGSTRATGTKDTKISPLSLDSDGVHGELLNHEHLRALPSC